jgi:fused
MLITLRCLKYLHVFPLYYSLKSAILILLSNKSKRIVYYFLLYVQKSVSIRAKCCNLIGNLCRHSSRFYSILSTSVSGEGSSDMTSYSMQPISFPCSPLTLLTACCADVDASTRKFACFAVGNAAFHCEALYLALHCSIPLLTAAAEGEADEKTRANAAGAIGNLVRNGGILAAEMARVGVPVTLLRSVLIETDLPTQRIALFSLGTMAVYPSCR